MSADIEDQGRIEEPEGTGFCLSERIKDQRIYVCLSERYYVASVLLVLHCASLLGRYLYIIHIGTGSRLFKSIRT